MGKKKSGHFSDEDLKGHIQIKGSGTENGACLTGHLVPHRINTCSYRYQGREAAKSAPIKPKLETYDTAPDKITTSGVSNPKWYVDELAKPEPGQWDVEGPKRKIKIGTKYCKPGRNFKNAKFPYWNNAHHILPKGTLKSCILELADGDSNVSDTIQKCLFKARYNVNHKKNMLLMPQDKEVAKILGLPRHIELKYNDGNAPSNTFNHPKYNAKVGADIKVVLKTYLSLIKGGDEDGHPNPDTNLDKSQLEAKSLFWLNWILTCASPGLSIDHHAMDEPTDVMSI